MSKFLLILSISGYLSISCQGDSMLGPGLWSLIGIEDCEDENQLPEIKTIISIEKHRFNRTHDGINANITAIEDITEEFGVLILICKFVDGGCKDYQTISDDSLARMVREYSYDNMVAALQQAKKDPPDFPIEKGEYFIEDYIMDYCKLPPKSVYGKFEASIYLIFKTLRVGCLKCILEFNKFEDDENICEE